MKKNGINQKVLVRERSGEVVIKNPQHQSKVIIQVDRNIGIVRESSNIVIRKRDLPKFLFGLTKHYMDENYDYTEVDISTAMNSDEQIYVSRLIAGTPTMTAGYSKILPIEESEPIELNKLDEIKWYIKEYKIPESLKEIAELITENSK